MEVCHIIYVYIYICMKIAPPEKKTTHHQEKGSKRIKEWVDYGWNMTETHHFKAVLMMMWKATWGHSSQILFWWSGLFPFFCFGKVRHLCFTMEKHHLPLWAFEKVWCWINKRKNNPYSLMLLLKCFWCILEMMNIHGVASDLESS